MTLPTQTSSKSSSFFIILTIGIALAIALAYLVFSPSGSAMIEKIDLAIVSVQIQSAGIADAGNSQLAQARLTNPIGTNGTLAGFLNRLLDVLIMLGSIVIVFMIILAGMRYVLARGNDAEIQKAHTQLTWTAIGAAVLLGAKVISMVIANTVRSLSQ